MDVPDFTEDEFFRTVTFSWPRDRPGLVFPVANQGRTNTCVAHVVRDTIYSELVPMYEDRIRRGKLISGITEGLTIHEACVVGPQELLDRLVDYISPRGFDRSKPIAKEGPPMGFKHAFTYVKDIGVYSEKQYPFMFAKQNFVKPTLNPDLKIFIHDFARIKPEEYGFVVQQLHKQPLTGKILAVPSFMHWKVDQGVYRGPTPEEIDFLEQSRKQGDRVEPYHAITIVGYGVEQNISYYLCKNSYGTNWGYYGYFKADRVIIRNICYPVKPFLGPRKISLETSVFGA